MPLHLKSPWLAAAFAAACFSLSSAFGQLVIGGKEFERNSQEAGAKGEWVIYPKGAKQDEAHRRWLTEQVLVELQRGRRFPIWRKCRAWRNATFAAALPS